jgi:predicted porin
MAMLSRGRDTAIIGRDASVALMGGFGTVRIGAVESGNGIIGLGGAGAPVLGMDGATGLAVAAAAPVRAPLFGAVNVDLLAYTTPVMGGFALTLGLLDAPTAYGMQDTAATQDFTWLKADYSAGALVAMADYTIGGKNAVAATGLDNRTRLSASYNLGVAKLGAGYETRTNYVAAANNIKATSWIVGASVPMGAVTLGLNYARSTQDNAGDSTGFDLGAQYDLSKRTNVRVMYQDLKQDAGGSGATTTVDGSAKTTRVRLMHSF